MPGFEVEIVGTDAHVDRRLPSVAEVPLPYFEEMRLGVPTLPGMAGVLATGDYDLVHLATPGPAGLAALIVARVMGLPVMASHHTELSAYAELRGHQGLGAGVHAALAAFYAACASVMSPSTASDDALTTLGVPAERIRRWDRGVDLSRFTGRRPSRPASERVDVLYAGRVTKEKGSDLLADAFLAARRRDPRLHLVVAGGGPELGALRARVDSHATFLGWLAPDRLADAYAAADLLCFPSTTDTFGQVVVEAQASGLPVLAADRGGPLDLIEDGVTGLLRDPWTDPFADALVELAGSATLRDRLRTQGLRAARNRTWMASMGQLAHGYRCALGAPATVAEVVAA